MDNQVFFNSLPLNCKNDPISIGMLDGYNLAAPQSFWDADDELRNAIVGGCGPGGGIGDMLVPDRMWGLKVTAACKIHDWCFAGWNDKLGFELANDIFKNNLLRIIHQKKSCKFLKFLRKRRAIKYYGAVQFFGETAFFDSHLQYIK